MLTIDFNHRLKIEKILLSLERSTPALASLPRTCWVVYGSLVTNTMTEKSDLDVMYIHADGESPPARVQAFYDGIPATIYTLCLNDFMKDGAEGRYGGYFSGKTINPHIVFTADETVRVDIRQAAAGFIFPFALHTRRNSRNGSYLTKEALASDAVQGFMDYCPWYENYFVRLFANPAFGDIWQKMATHITQGFIANGYVREVGQGLYLYNASLVQGKDDAKAINEMKLLRSARFWSWGSVFHGSNPDFIDDYIAHAKRENMSEHLEKMHEFLAGQAKPVATGIQTRIASSLAMALKAV